MPLLAEEVESAKASGMEWLIESTCKSLWDAVDLLIGLAVWYEKGNMRVTLQ
jgi:hypothetical protein